MRFTKKKFMSSLIAASILFSSLPSLVLAEDNTDEVTPTTSVEATIVESTSETTTVETTTETTVDENVTSIPTDETEPTTETVEDIEEPPIDSTESSSETVAETTNETTAETSETTAETTASESVIVTAKDSDEFYSLLAKLPDDNRLIVDTTKDISMIKFNKAIYFDGTYFVVFNSTADKNAAMTTLTTQGISFADDGELSICSNDDEDDWTYNGIGEDDDTLPEDWNFEDTDPVEEEIVDKQINPNAKTKIAIIDTGSNKANETYSILGDDGKDKNGHGTEMANLVLNGSDDAYIISIKAIGNDGKGQMSDVYAAIQMAIDLKVDYILMSISIRDTGKYEAFKDLINSTDIKIITSAGNNGTDAKKYLPANIDKIYTVGAIDYETVIMPFSNYGSTVDYYMSADSTSEAAAKVAGLLIAGETEINAYAEIDAEHYYYEGSEFEFEVDTIGSTKYYFAADARVAGKTYTQVRSLMYNYAKGQVGKNQPNGCIDLAMHAMNYAVKGTAKPSTAFKSTIWNQNKAVVNSGKKFDFSSAGCTTFMKSRAGISPSSKIGVYALTGSGPSKIEKNISNGKKFYDYCKSYAKPGDIILFSNNSKWVHAAVFAGTVTGSKSEMYGGSYRPGIVVYESPGVGKAARKRIISAADFAVSGDKQFTTAVIIKAAPDDVTLSFTVSKSVPVECQSLMTSLYNQSLYSYEGTKYGLYSDAECTTLLTEFDIDESGKSDDKFTVTVGATYYVKEIVAGPGLSLSDTVYTLTINSNTTATFNGKTISIASNTFTGEVQDTPVYDPITINLRKVDNFGKPVNGATMTGATFIIEYYSEDLGDPNATDTIDDGGDVEDDPDEGDPDVNDDVEDGGEDPDQPIEVDTTIEPKVIYRITFDGTGLKVIRLSDLQALTPIGGTDLYYLKNLYSYTNGEFPLGTFRIYEETAPNGYSKNEQVIRIRLYQDDPDDPDSTATQYIVETETGTSRFWNHTLNGSDMSLVLAEAPEVGYYELTKDIPVNGYNLNGFEFELWNKTENIQIATGVSQADGSVLWTYTIADYYSNVDPTKLLTGETTTKLELALGPADNRIEYEVREKVKTDTTDASGIPVTFLAPTVTNKTVTTGQGYYAITETFTENGATVSRTFNNTPASISINLRKSDISVGATPKAYTFNIYWLGNGDSANESASKLARTVTITTGNDGTNEITITGLPLGWYKVVETDSKGLAISYPNGQIIDGRTNDRTVTFDVINYIETVDIGTTLKDKTTDEKICLVGNTTLIDTVSYSGLTSGHYVVTGVIYDKTTGQPLKVNDNNVIGKAEFDITPKYNKYNIELQQEGTIDVEFTFDTTGLDGKSLVAFEELHKDTENGTKIAEHKDINDIEQTVFIPKIHTVLLDSETNIGVASNKDTVTLIDTIYYENLVPDKEYTLSGILMKKDGSTTTFVGTRTFTPTSENSTIDSVSGTASGTTTVEFTVSTTDIKGEIFVAFETLSYDGKEILHDNNIDNDDETIYITDIFTTMTDVDTEEHITAQDTEVELVDVVTYESLRPGKTYKMTGTLYDKETGEPLKDKSGNVVTASQEFTPDSANGTVKITFKFSRDLLKGQTFVAFEKLTYNDIEVATHNDINDKDQTVDVPNIHTTFFDKTLGIDEDLVSYGTNVVLVDRVYYDHIVPNKEYTLKGKIMIKETGEALKDDENNDIIVTKTFTPESSEGYVDIEFTVDTTKLKGKTLVAFETLIYKNFDLVIHADIDDVDQTVNVPDVQTTATDKVDSDKTVDGTKTEQTIVDTVKYTNLIVDKQYTITGKLVVKKDYKDGEELEYVKDKDGNILTVSKTFTAKSTSGTEELEFTFDASKYAGYQVVVFEDLYYNDILIGTHADITDENQTIEISLLLHIKIAKMDGKNVKYVLRNAEITIYRAALDANGELVKDAKGNVIYEVVKDTAGNDCIGMTDTDGFVDFTITWDRHFKYFAKETKAPRGYNINDTYFEVVPTENREDLGVCLIPIQIVDFAIPPRTGDTTPVGLLAGISLIAVAVVIAGAVFLINKKKAIKTDNNTTITETTDTEK